MSWSSLCVGGGGWYDIQWCHLLSRKCINARLYYCWVSLEATFNRENILNFDVTQCHDYSSTNMTLGVVIMPSLRTVTISACFKYCGRYNCIVHVTVKDYDSCLSIVTIPGHQQGGVQLPRNGWSKVRSWLLEAWKWHHSPGDSCAIV